MLPMASFALRQASDLGYVKKGLERLGVFLSKPILTFLINLSTFCIGFFSNSMLPNFTPDNTNKISSIHSHDDLEQYHSHKYYHHDDKTTHDHGSDDEDEHNHCHVHLVACSCLHILRQEEKQQQQKYLVGNLEFSYEKMIFDHHPSKILRPPITLQT